MTIQSEHKKLSGEQEDLTKLLDQPVLQWEAIDKKLTDIKKRFGPDMEGGTRRTGFSSAPVLESVPMEAMVEREPITVVYSRRGWLRAIKTHLAPDASISFKEGDEERFRFHAYTTDRILAFTSQGRMHTLLADKFPGGRGHGEPLRILVDLQGDEEVVAMLPYDPDSRLLLASSDGRGFLIEADKALASTRSGRQVMNVATDVRATHCLPVDGDMVAVIGENRRLLIFPLDDIPVMTRGRGVILQRYRDGGLSDLCLITKDQGLSWPMGG